MLVLTSLNGIILATRWTNKTGRRKYEIMNMIVNFNISFIIDDINYNKIMKGITLKNLLKNNKQK